MRALFTAAASLLRVAWRYRWTFAVPVATLVLPAVLYAVRLADEYRASALVHARVVQPEHIGRGLPEERGAQTEEILATVRDRLRAKIPVAAAAKVLYPDEIPDGVPALEKTRARLSYEQIGSGAFSVSLAAGDPESAAAATNELVQAFLEGERALRLRRADNNREFHEKELEAAQAAYRAALDVLDAFRSSHADTLPESRDGTREVLRRIGTEMTAQDGVIAAARERMQDLDTQMASLQATLPDGKADTDGAAGEAMRLQLSQAQRALHGARKELAELRARYTEKHPDVVRLKTAVAVHEAAVKESVAALERVRTQARGEAGRTAKRLLDSRRAGLMELRAVTERDVDRAEARKAVLRKRESELHTRLVGIPATEAAMQPLARDLDEAGKVLAIRQQDAAAARAAVQFYRSGDVSDVTRFRVDAWAAVPVHPSGPARWRYLATALVLGSIIGYGLLLLQRKLEGNPLESVDDLSEIYPLAVVVEVPDLGDGTRRLLPRIRVGDLLMTGYVAACLVLSVMAVAVQRGWTDGPAWMQKLILG